MAENKWGGRREGAGRKKNEIERKAYTRRLSQDEIEYLDKCLKEYRETHKTTKEQE